MERLDFPEKSGTWGNMGTGSPGPHTITARYMGVDGRYTASSFENTLTVQP
jgi:hypothetical protein